MFVLVPLQHNVSLTCVIYQVAGDKELLDTARDCFRFATTFFEPISVSAVHIYHSALELSPLSSIVRRLYHHQRHSPLPRVVIGTQGSWDECSTTHFSGKFGCGSFTWSPCGQFVAANYQGGTEIRDVLTSELLSTLRPTKPTSQTLRTLAYSPDGRSIAVLSDTSFTIWDIQTGGVAREVECGAVTGVSLVWSLDGRVIGTMLLDKGHSNYTMHTYDVDSGAAQFHGTFQSIKHPHLWAYDKTFRIMAAGDTIDIFEVGFVLTKIESFRIGSLWNDALLVSFSPTTYQIAIWDDCRLYVFDIRNCKCLLKRGAEWPSHCFSSDGSLFAAVSMDCVQIWQYDSGHYTAWGEFHTQGINTPLQFSPDLSSIAGWSNPGLLRVWLLDRLPVTPDGFDDKSLTALSQCGTYVATNQSYSSTVVITNTLSQSPSQFIDTGIWTIGWLALTGSVLLVMEMGWENITAWRLTEEGVVDGPPGGGRADRSHSIWTIIPRSEPRSGPPTILIRDQIVVMECGSVTHAYHTGTGEALEHTLTPSHPRDRQYSLGDLMNGSHHLLHHRSLDVPSTDSEDDWPVSWTTLREGWVEDPEGRHRMWVPPAWRVRSEQAGWYRNIMTLWLEPRYRTIIVKF